MNNFSYYNPTRIVFGQDSIAELKNLIQPEQRVLMTYGGGSIKRNGVHAQVMKALAGHEVREFGGIQPNPAYETLMQAVALARREKIDLLLAVGGGSVLDGTKFIAAVICYEGADPWEILTQQAPVKKALPLGSVLTLPATGSEMNAFAVISRTSTNEKLAFCSEHVYPRFAVLDPKTTMSLPPKQTRNGVVDAWVHVMEQYATYPVGAAMQDRQAEAVLLALRDEGPKVLARPHDYDARANVMWCATHALNGLLGCGVPQDWATHMIGHELTAFYGIDHAESLAVVLPALWRHEKKRKAGKLEQYARRVWAETAADSEVAIEAGIARTVAFFESLGMKTHLADYGISPAEAAERIGDRFAQRGTRLGEHGDLTADQVATILRQC
jgi:NADP-dependent alcohol dehydrogenase